MNRMTLLVKKVVLFLLFLTFLAPILVFYTAQQDTIYSPSFSSHSSSFKFNSYQQLTIKVDTFCFPFLTNFTLLILTHLHVFAFAVNNHQFIQDASATTSSSGASKTRKLNLLKHESLKSLKEPVGIIYLDNSAKYVSTKEFKDFTLPVSREHKTRVLSATAIEEYEEDGGNESDTENPIKQVVQGDEGENVLNSEELTEEMGRGEVDQAVEEEEEEEQKVSRQENQVNQASVRNSVEADSEKPLDGTVTRIKDQLIRARVFLGINAIRRNSQLMKELRSRMRELQRALGEASMDSQLSRNAYEKSKAMEQALVKGKQIQDDSPAVIKKLRAMLQSTEEQLRAHRRQTQFLTQLTAKTLPKGLHCLPLRLSTEYYSLSPDQQQFPHQQKLEDPKLYHYALFSDNILATAVVVNSTIFHAKDPSKHVFHIVTDSLNYEAMRMWFLANLPGKATVQVQHIEEFVWLNSSYSPVLKQLGFPSMIDYYFKVQRANSDSKLKFRNPKYMSILNHLRFYLPEIFPKLKKVLFLDDDVVVQKDLTGLWSIDLKGKVNGAVETCSESFHRFDRYLNFSNPLISKNFDPHACGWAFGMNIFDLQQWRKQNITELYHTWLRLNQNRQLWKLGTLPPGLITFWNRTFSLDRSWHVLGLGYDPTVEQKEIKQAAVIHYNGNMKPWLEVGIGRYRNYWVKFVDYSQVYLRDCNINA